MRVAIPSWAGEYTNATANAFKTTRDGCGLWFTSVPDGHGIPKSIGQTLWLGTPCGMDALFGFHVRFAETQKRKLTTTTIQSH